MNITVSPPPEVGNAVRPASVTLVPCMRDNARPPVGPIPIPFISFSVFHWQKYTKKPVFPRTLNLFRLKNTEVLARFQKYMLTLHPSMKASTDYIEDEVYGQRLLISVNAGHRLHPRYSL